MSPGEFFGNATVSAIVGGLTAWGATHFLQRSYSKHAAQDDISDLLSELRAEAVIYWLQAGRDADLERAIIKLSSRSSGKCNRYAKKYQPKRNVPAIRARSQTLHHALTGGDFQTITRMPNPARIAEIDRNIEELKRELEI